MITLMRGLMTGLVFSCAEEDADNATDKIKNPKRARSVNFLSSYRFNPNFKGVIIKVTEEA
jgi:hypothetical protein